MAKKGDPVHKVTLANGELRYRFVIDMGKDAAGKRRQKTFTYQTMREARAERARIISARAAGTFVAPTKTTVSEAVESWLKGKRNLRPGTRRTYTDALRHAQDKIGHVLLQRVTKGHVDDMVTELLASGRKVGNVQSTELSPRTVNVVLRLLAAVFDDCMKQGTIGRNVVKLADRPSQSRQEMKTWSAEQAAAFLRYTADDRLSAAWQLSLYGLRRGEVLGLRWSDVDLAKRRLTVQWARTSVAGVVVEGEPKTERSKRTLPMDDGLVDALSTLQLAQRDEAEQAGDAYQPACDLCGGHHVVGDELGRPYRPAWYGDRFEGLVKASRLPMIRLHDVRHTCGSLMHLRGVKTATISKWLGHASAAFTMAVYVHTQDDDMQAAGQTLRGAIGAKAENLDVR